MRAMNLERTFTIVAGLMIAVVVGLYTVDMENGLRIASAQAQSGAASEGIAPGRLDDAQMLTTYQATLPHFFVEPEGMAQQAEVGPGQLANRQVLANYQATLTGAALPLEAVDGALVQAPQTEAGPRQLVDRQMLADYQSTLTGAVLPMQAVEGSIVQKPAEPIIAAENR